MHAVHTLEEQKTREIRVTLKYRKRVARARERLGWLCGVDSWFGSIFSFAELAPVCIALAAVGLCIHACRL